MEDYQNDPDTTAHARNFLDCIKSRKRSTSDVEIGFLYSPMIRDRYQDVDLILSCGDLPYYYIEYMVSMLNVPCYFVRGNHASSREYGVAGMRKFPWGAVDLHRRCREDDTGLLIAGRNPVCTDAVATAVMGFDPDAPDRGRGKPDLQEGR